MSEPRPETQPEQQQDVPGVRELVDKYCDGDIDATTPDGFHYTPTFHRVIGTQLAEQIAEWSDTQPHLAR